MNPGSNGNSEEVRHTGLDRLQSAFLAVMSHELRTPLTEIIAATSILADGYPGPLNQEQIKYLQVIENAAEHLTKLIQDLLAFAQLEAEVVQVIREPVSLNHLVDMAVELYVIQAEQKHLALAPELAPDLPPIPLDRTKIMRVLSNLLSNACKYTHPEGRISVRTFASEAGQAVEVADDGGGIPTEKQSHIFESFYQVDDPLTRDVGGLGIGLAYARRIVEAHGGRITFKSVEGQGSVFTVWLPARVDTPPLTLERRDDGDEPDR